MQKTKTSIGNKNKQAQSAVLERATRRLKRDLIQIHKEPLAGVTAAPLEKNIFVWHCNLAGPVSTVWENGIFHLILTFPRYEKNIQINYQIVPILMTHQN